MNQQLGQNLFMANALKYGFSLWGIPKTGQTTEYRSGDDGTYQKGYPKSGSRFTDNGDGTVTDNASGLMWVKDPSQLGGVWGTPGVSSFMSWNNAIDNCLSLVYAGHSDWRLPNIKELINLVDYGRSNPAIDPLFQNTRSNYYWASTTAHGVATHAWTVGFGSGGILGFAKTGSYYPRPVRLNV